MNPNTVNNTNAVGTVRLVNAAGGFMANKAEVKKVEPNNPFVSFGYILFVICVLTSSGIFFYDRVLDQKATVAVEEVKKYNESLKKLPLTDIHALLDKLVAVNDIAHHHTIVTSTLRFIETITNKDVYWRSLDYRLDDKGKVTLILSGSTQYLSTVIQQVDEFQDTKYAEYISNVDISGVTIAKKTDTLPQKVDLRVKMSIVKPFSDLDFDKFLAGYVAGNKLQPTINANINLDKSAASTSISTSTNKTVSTSTSKTVNTKKL